MAPSANLCSRTDVKTHLGLSGTAHDAAIDLLVPAASEAVEQHCRRRFALASYTEYYDGRGANRIVLRQRPVLSVSHVWDDPDGEFEDDSLLESEEYVLDAERGMVLLRSGRFFDGVRNVKVAYQAGHSPAPSDVARACILLAAEWFRRGREAGGEILPQDVLRLLAPYREAAV